MIANVGLPGEQAGSGGLTSVDDELMETWTGSEDGEQSKKRKAASRAERP